ncbi:MAG: phage holin family protein [Cyanobacteria bacterium P01_A01_bin.84]
MLGYLFTLLGTALSLLVVDIIFPGVNIATFPAALIAGVIIGLVNSFIKPILSVLSLPLNILSLGLFSLVLNGICLWIASAFAPGFSVTGPLAFILAPVVLSVVSSFVQNYFAEKNPDVQINS